jgi:hypothetical protein
MFILDFPEVCWQVHDYYVHNLMFSCFNTIGWLLRMAYQSWLVLYMVVVYFLQKAMHQSDPFPECKLTGFIKG